MFETILEIFKNNFKEIISLIERHFLTISIMIMFIYLTYYNIFNIQKSLNSLEVSIILSVVTMLTIVVEYTFIKDRVSNILKKIKEEGTDKKEILEALIKITNVVPNLNEIKEQQESNSKSLTDILDSINGIPSGIVLKDILLLRTKSFMYELLVIYVESTNLIFNDGDKSLKFIEKRLSIIKKDSERALSDYIDEIDKINTPDAVLDKDSLIDMLRFLNEDIAENITKESNINVVLENILFKVESFKVGLDELAIAYVSAYKRILP